MQPDVSSARPTVARRRATLAATIALCAIALTLGACAEPTATPEPPPPTVLPDPPTVEPPTATAVVTPTATLTPTATAAPALPTGVYPNPIVPTAVASPVGVQPAAAQPTVAAPVAQPTTAPTANSGLPLVEFYPDNGQANLGKDQLCTAVNWHTENVTDVRLQIGGGPATAVAASGRQGDICFGEDKLKVRLIYKHKDGREESREIDLTREDD